ncbi:MAG: hypothetical protein R3F48_16430 [Candidatus Zixiibacteriota bacterium]
MKRIMTTATIAIMAFAMMFSASADASNEVKKHDRPIRIVKRVEHIGAKHTIVFFEYRNRHGDWVRHGEFTEKIRGRVIVTGQYVHGRKDGDWIYRTNDCNNRIATIETYDNGTRIDVYKPVYSAAPRKKTVEVCHTPRHTDIRVRTPHVYVNLGF